MPAEILAIAGLTHPPVYVDVDEAVWAWACADFVALALGHKPETPIPLRFAHAAGSIPEPAGLVEMACNALQIVSAPQRSELAALLKEADDQPTFQRIERLHSVLRD